MAVKLNLLPAGANVTPVLAKTLRLIKTLGIVALGLFLFFILGVSGYLIYTNISLRNLTTQEENLKTRIKDQETVEQKMVLLKDRLGKIVKVKSSPTVQKGLESAEAIITSLPAGAILTERNLDQKKTDMSLVFGSSLDLNTFLTVVKTTGEFKRASLTAFSFNPSSGYSIGLRFFEN